MTATLPASPAPTDEERTARWLYADDDCGVWLDDPGPHSGDCTKECHTCRRCLQDQYSKKAARLLAELRRHRSSPSAEWRGMEPTNDMATAGARILGATMHADNQHARAIQVYRAMAETARTGKVPEPPKV